MSHDEYVPIRLASSFKAALLTKVSLVRYTPNNQKFKVEAPQFSGNHGEHNKEALLYVVREFQHTVLDELHLHGENPDEPDPVVVKGAILYLPPHALRTSQSLFQYNVPSLFG
jgi:hypothetical protein